MKKSLRTGVDNRVAFDVAWKKKKLPTSAGGLSADSFGTLDLGLISISLPGLVGKLLNIARPLVQIFKVIFRSLRPLVRSLRPLVRPLLVPLLDAFRIVHQIINRFKTLGYSKGVVLHSDALKIFLLRLQKFLRLFFNRSR